MFITEWKKAICKGGILYVPDQRTFWKGRTIKTVKASGVKGEGEGKQSTDCQDTKTLLYAMCHYAFIKTQSVDSAKSEPCCTLWTLGDNVSLCVPAQVCHPDAC